MSALHVLRRSDTHILHVATSDDPAACAAALSKDQAFEVEVLATFPSAGGLLEAVQWNLGPPVKGAWYAKPVSEALAAVAEVLEDEEEAPPVEAEEAEERAPKRRKRTPAQEEPQAQPEPREPTPLPAALAEHLEVCGSAEAPKATDICQALKQKLGNAAQELLKDTRQVSVSDAAGHKRRILKLAGCARGEALRLRVAS
jgi:hypothetical protein